MNLFKINIIFFNFILLFTNSKFFFLYDRAIFFYENLLSLLGFLFCLPLPFFNLLDKTKMFHFKMTNNIEQQQDLDGNIC